MTIKPHSDKVLLEKIEADERIGKLIIPEHLREKGKDIPLRGRVKQVGPGKYGSNGSLQPVQAQIGDVVVYSKARAIEIRDAGKDYILIPEADILYFVQD